MRTDLDILPNSIVQGLYALTHNNGKEKSKNNDSDEEDGFIYIPTQFEVDERSIALAGFSDGATYALSLGLSQCPGISHIIAHSPGYLSIESIQCRPEVFISHGRSDTVLNIDRCSRKILSQLKELGISPYYVELEGGHSLYPSVIQQAMTWFLKSDEARNLDLGEVDTRSQGIERT